MFNQQFGQGVRTSTDSMDELVARNIQEVLQAAELQDAELAAGNNRGGQPSAAGRGKQSVISSNRAAPGQASSTAAAAAAAAGPSVLPSTQGQFSSSSMLDVPGHAEATIRLHKARIKALEDEHAKLGKALAERDRALGEAVRETKGLRTEQLAWAKERKALEAQVERGQRRAADAEAAMSAREQAFKDSNKEGSRMDKEKRVVEQDARARDVRLQRALEEVERHKATLQELRAQEREGKDVAKTDFNRLAADNKKLERQKGELLLAFKKQLKLIDVLKRQKVHLEAARALQFSEAEFLQTLELGSA
mmetsp:Transcript_2929/g.5022  ORF Transcript_2929/g.5022 Transcript_2929/m.5022 type:complete len:307 (-) Transcript_2929:131-1051(-)